jgi:hypothetical protein
MAKYVKKPIPIDAWQCTYENYKKGLPAFIEIEIQSKEPRVILIVNDEDRTISGFCETLEGMVNITDGCYIIKGVSEEFYPCDAAIFEKSYKEV